MKVGWILQLHPFLSTDTSPRKKQSCRAVSGGVNSVWPVQSRSRKSTKTKSVFAFVLRVAVEAHLHGIFLSSLILLFFPFSCRVLTHQKGSPHPIQLTDSMSKSSVILYALLLSSVCLVLTYYYNCQTHQIAV